MNPMALAQVNRAVWVLVRQHGFSSRVAVESVMAYDAGKEVEPEVEYVCEAILDDRI